MQETDKTSRAALNVPKPLTLTAQLSALKEATFALKKTPIELVKFQDDGVCLAVTDLFEVHLLAEDIEETVLRIPETDDEHFFVTEYLGKKAVGESRLGSRIFKQLGHAPNIVRKFPDIEFSPAFNCFREEFDKARLWDVDSLKKLGIDDAADGFAERLNAAVRRIREHVRSAKFRAAHNNFHRAALKNLTALRRYGVRLFTIHQRLLVVGLDLGYAPGTFAGHSFDIGFDKVAQDWKKWIRLVKKTLADSYCGYAKRISWGPEGTFKVTVVVFLSCRGQKSGIGIGKALGRIWESLTENKGIFFNWNARRSDAHHTGFGTINAADHKKQVALDLVFQGLTRPDYFLKMKTPGSMKSFTKGDHPTPKHQLAPNFFFRQKRKPSFPTPSSLAFNPRFDQIR